MASISEPKNLRREHDIVSQEEWIAARTELLKKEKEFTRLRDQLSAERRKLPWPTLHDQPGPGKTALSDYYGVMFIPLPILIDRDGKVVSLTARGAELEKLLEKHIGPLQEKAAGT